MIPITEFLSSVRQRSQEQFVLVNPYPVLIYRGMSGPGTEEASSRFTTQAITRLSIRESATARPQLPEQPSSSFMFNVFPLSKRPGSAYGERISVGRVRTCDIQIPFARVSKFHAYFTWSPDRSFYFITDAGATNGTFLGGVPLAPNVPTRLGNDANLLFGPYMFTFLASRALYDFLLTLST